MKDFFNSFFDELDENKTYYTDEMFQQELGRFALYVMLRKELLTDEEYSQLESDFKKIRNGNMIQGLKRLKNQ